MMVEPLNSKRFVLDDYHTAVYVDDLKATIKELKEKVNTIVCPDCGKYNSQLSRHYCSFCDELVNPVFTDFSNIINKLFGEGLV